MSVQIRPRAVADIDIALDEIDRTLRTPAEVFRQRLERTLNLLEQFPLLGGAYEPAADEYPGLRVCPVRGWVSYAVYYLPNPDGITVVRLLHSSRNVAAIFNPPPDPDE